MDFIECRHMMIGYSVIIYMSLVTGNCRGLVHGRLWRRDGVLAVSCAQEGVFRVKQDPAKSKL